MRTLPTAVILTLALVGSACSSLSGQEPGIAAPVPTLDTIGPATTEPPTTQNEPTTPTEAATTSETTEPAPILDSASLTGELTVEILETVDHDTDAFTQGLELLPDGRLVESTGLRGASDRRIVDPATGAVLATAPVDPSWFAEGITLADDRLVQLTWTSGIAVASDPDTLEQIEQFRYDGEGWGLCWMDDRFVMSDGSSTLTFRDRDFEIIDTVDVTINGQPLDRINELECVGDRVWANVWQAQVIVGIDPSTGEVVARLDASPLQPDGLSDADDVLNGIAHDERDDTYWLTGKRWPVMHRVRIVPNPGAAGQ